MTTEEKEEKVELYSGGNELFFSFVLSLLQGVDQGLLTREGLESVVSNWSASWAKNAGVSGNLDRDLDKVSDALVSLGLVRVFAPARGTGDEIKVLVLRCLLGKYVEMPRVRSGLPRHCMLVPIIKGALSAGGKSFEIIEDRKGMLRSDECTLIVKPGGGQ